MIFKGFWRKLPTYFLCIITKNVDSDATMIYCNSRFISFDHCAKKKSNILATLLFDLYSLNSYFILWL